MTVVQPPEVAIHPAGGGVEELSALLFSQAAADGEDDLGVLFLSPAPVPSRAPSSQ